MTGRPPSTLPSCSLCRHPMTEGRLSSHAFPECRACGFAWLPGEVLGLLLASIERRYRVENLSTLAAEAEERRRALANVKVSYPPCPECGSRMHRKMFGRASYLVHHQCAAHGHLVDREDLDRMISYVARGGDVLELEQLVDERTRRLQEVSSELTEARSRAPASSGLPTEMMTPWWLD